MDRAAAGGRTPGWSLHLNPTPLIEEAGLPDADAYRFLQQRKEHAAARDCRNRDRHEHAGPVLGLGQ